MSEKTRPELFGILQADAIMEASHLTYNAPRGRKMVRACIERLEERIEELQPKKADVDYKKARYSDRKKSK